MKKGLLLTAVMLLLAALLVGCASKDTEPVATAPAVDATQVAGQTGAQLELTIEELAQYDGKDGRAAYVAVDGVIYDVTNVPQWSGGTHNGNLAGQDLTEAIKKAPHGTSTLEGLPVVGTLKTGS